MRHNEGRNARSLQYGERMKTLFMAAGLCGLLGLSACNLQPPVQNIDTVAGNYVLDLQKPGRPNLRLWLDLRQVGSELYGSAYAGYVTPPSDQFMEPYSGKVTGSVMGTKVQFTVNINDFYDTNAQVNYVFSASTGVPGRLGGSGTWTRALVSGEITGTGTFSAVTWAD